jgi:hypothetical protein
MTTTDLPPAPTAENTTHALWIDVADVAEAVFLATMTTGGATICTTAPSDVPQSGYAVALAGREMRGPRKYFTRETVEEYIRLHIDATTLPGIYVGAWHDVDSDDVFLDLSMIFRSRTVAEGIGRESGQIAIWDFAEQREIRL